MFDKYFNNQFARDGFVLRQLKQIPSGSSILDAGAGIQPYKKDCSHLKYYSQDFGEVVIDNKKGFSSLKSVYEYGAIDYKCDIIDIPVPDSSFDAVLCTEVFEHIPDPISALKELYRILKPNGTLILTLPSNCMRHFDPYFFYSGFSDRWLEYWLPKTGFNNIKIEQDGNYFKWMAVENARTFRQLPSSMPFLASSLLYFVFRSFKPSENAKNTLCYGYWIVCKK